MRPLYGKPKAENYWFTIYHSHYKEKPETTEFAYNYYLVPHLTTMIGVNFQ